MEISELLSRLVFYQWFRAVQKHSTETGQTLHINRDRAGITISQKISFTHLDAFIYHITDVIGGKENIKIKKDNKVTGELTKVAISAEKLAEIV